MSHQFIIIGTGFAAIIAAIELKRKGWHDFVMLERRSFAGGTWQQIVTQVLQWMCTRHCILSLVNHILGHRCLLNKVS